MPEIDGAPDIANDGDNGSDKARARAGARERKARGAVYRARTVNYLIDREVGVATAIATEALIFQASQSAGGGQTGQTSMYGALVTELLDKLELSAATPESIIAQVLTCAYDEDDGDDGDGGIAAARKAGPKDIPCRTCGCKVVVYEQPHRADEPGTMKYVCSNPTCRRV